MKELGPGGPVEGKPADILPPEDSHFGALSPQNSDLARLQQTNASLWIYCLFDDNHRN